MEDYKKMNSGKLAYIIMEKYDKDKDKDLRNSPEYKWYRKTNPDFIEFGEGAVWRSWD